MSVTQQKVKMEGGPYELKVHLELIYYGKWLGKWWGPIAFLSPHTHTPVDPNTPISGVWRVGNAPYVGSPKTSLGSSHPSCMTGGRPFSLFALFSLVVKLGMVILTLPTLLNHFILKWDWNEKISVQLLLEQVILCTAEGYPGGKVLVIPLTLIEHLLHSEASTAHQYKRRHHPSPEWHCYECFIFLKSMIFRVTVLASSHHSDMINSFIMLDWFNYLLCRFVYLICISIAGVLPISAYCTILLRKVLMLRQVPVVSPGAKTFL